MVGHGSGGMIWLRAAQKSATFVLPGDRKGGRIFTVDLYCKVRLACAGGMFRQVRSHLAKFRDKSIDPMSAPRYHDTVLGQVRPERTGRHGALPDPKPSGSMKHQKSLILA